MGLLRSKVKFLTMTLILLSSLSLLKNWSRNILEDSEIKYEEYYIEKTNNIEIVKSDKNESIEDVINTDNEKNNRTLAVNWKHGCMFRDPPSKQSVRFPCGSDIDQNFVSIVKSVCETQLGNQLSSFGALVYFQVAHGYRAFLDPFQAKEIGKVFVKEKLGVGTFDFYRYKNNHYDAIDCLFVAKLRTQPEPSTIIPPPQDHPLDRQASWPYIHQEKFQGKDYSIQIRHIVIYIHTVKYFGLGGEGVFKANFGRL